MKLNIGAGNTQIPGFEPLDIRNGQNAYPLTGMADNSVEEIYASHILEHFPAHQTAAVLAEWVRVLAPGGSIRIAVPNLEYCVNAYLSPGETDAHLEGWILGSGTDENDIHRALFDPRKLERLMAAAGLVDVAPWTSEITDCASLPVSLNRCGVKPGTLTSPQEPKAPKIVAIWSTPRLGFMANFDCLYATLPQLGIPLIRGMGVFWGQGMERTATEAIEKNDADAILTLDYDSVYTIEDVKELIRLFVARPEAAAVIAHQWNRAADRPLWNVCGEGGERLTVSADELLPHDLFQITTGHFGLTLLRTSILKQMPHPWFKAIPNDAGRWDEGKVDSDIYFWEQFARAGHPVYLAQKVVIGHLEQAVRWPGADLSVQWQHMYDYHNNGKPAGLFGDTTTETQSNKDDNP